MNLNENMVTTIDEDMKTPFSIKGITKLVDENDITIQFEVFNFTQGKNVSFSLKRSELTARMLKKQIVRNGGISMDENKLLKLVDYNVNNMLYAMYYDEKYADSVWCSHKSLGWAVRDGVLEFDHDNIIQKDKIVSSQYRGRFDIEPQGTLENIKVMIDKCVVGNVPMMAIMTFGAAATALSYSNKVWNTNIYNPIIHLVSNSSRGKSTAAKLLASFAGNPEGANSCCLTFLATSNAILKRIGTSYGVPFAIDEFSMSKSKAEWTDFVYTLSNGFDKDRCSAGGAELQSTGSFQTVFVTNGETSILRKCNGNEGIRARLFEIMMDSYTRSAEESDFIKETVGCNYGILTPLLAQELMCNSDKWNECRLFWKDTLKKRISEEKIVLNTADRIIDYVALFAMSCRLLSTVVGIEFNVNEVVDFLYLHMIFKNAEDSNIGFRAYEVIKQYIAQHKARFVQTFDEWMTPELSDDSIGFCLDKSYSNRKHKDAKGNIYELLYIFPEKTMEKLLMEYGFADVKVAMKDMQKAKLLRTHGDRPTDDFPVNGVKSRVYSVWLQPFQDFIEENHDEEEVISE